MEQEALQEAIQTLNDLELACLVCLVADQHCIVRAPENQLDEVQNELEAIVSTTFGFSCATLNCGPTTSVEELCDAVVDNSSDVEIESEGRASRSASTVAFKSSRRSSAAAANILDSRKVAHVVIAKNLDQTVRNVQIQALELMRSRRIYSRTAVHATPKRFLFICLISSSLPGPPYLTPHLNDFFFISHTHVPIPNDAQSPDIPIPDTASVSSFSSIIRRRSTNPKRILHPNHRPLINEATIAQLQKLTSAVRTTAEIRRYTHNIITFLRLHRAVSGGVSAVSARHLYLLTRVLAPLHGQSFITPSLVPLAAHKVLPHRVELVRDPAAERSMQWGSSYEAVAAMLRDVAADKAGEGVLNDMFQEVPVPL